MKRLVGILLLASCWCSAVASDIPPPRPVDVAVLVRQLGSEDFAEREEASRRLGSLSVDDPPKELIDALKSANPEIRDRARRAVVDLKKHIARERERAATARLPREERFAKRGQVDLYVAATVASKLKTEDDRLWLPAFDLGVATAAKAELKGGYLPQGGPAWVKHFPTYRTNILNNTMIRTDGVFSRRKRDYFIFYGAVLAAGVDEPQSVKGLIVSRGTVRVGKSLDNSLVLATGEVIVGESMHGSAVICDGNLRVKGMEGCFVIARGDVIVDGWGLGNTVIAGGTAAFKKPVPLPNQQTIPKDRENRILEKVNTPLGFITFFELATVGVEVKVAEKGVQVAAIEMGKPFADAGGRVGDTITEVNGMKPDSAESLRRLLRDALAIGDATVKLNRDGKVETVKVSLAE
jgi:hypothetical protein